MGPILINLGHDVLLNICAEILEDAPRERVALSWCGETRMENEPPRIFPGPPSKLLLDLAPMHSHLAAATRPYIWREVLVAFGSYDATERGSTRLERAERPHIAPYVQALFLSFNFLGDSDEYVPQMVSVVSKFTGLRAVCLGTFQSYSQPRMYAPLAKAIRAHPRIDTLVVWHMARSTDLIAQGNSRPYHIHLEYCHEGSAAVLAKPKCLTSLSLQNMEQQNLAKHLPSNVWDTLKYLAPGYPDMRDVEHKFLQKSLMAYINSGRTPALRSLDLSEVSTYAPGRKGWLQLGKHLPLLRSFTFASRSTATMDEAKAMLKAFRHVRRLHFVAPSDEEYEDDSDEDEEQLELNPKFVTLLSKMPLEHLILDVWIAGDYLVDEDAPEEFGEMAVQELADSCEDLESVQLRYLWEGIECEDEPIVVEYSIKRLGTNAPALEVTEPRPLEGTLLEFLDWR
ncbi:hypothetical protein C8F04DRAFT_1396022 [Mycena alexandri]|uniref:Uncharacterized protein n=1 Tax=Mycena alexandri TaxID=1745969 RepID=A0AAD6X3D8_9AGAR|nr:hypothetical protein C8F04DRAFT_1396022 [Mycena alexandri]